MEIQTWIMIAMLVIGAVLWGQVVRLQAEAFKWRKRWIIERFGVGVEGTAGDYFIISQYTTGVPCLVFAKARKDFSMHSTTIRQWNSFTGRSFFGENCDLPDEKAVGLPENPARDNRAWVAAGLGLCPLPPSVHECAQRTRR
jgi:hypothetical protein